MAIVNSRAAIEPKTGKAAIFVNETIHSLIRKLFSNGEQVFFHDPNDLSTMFQDAAGTVPVTGAGQPVGLLLDKSKGLTLGANLISKPNTALLWLKQGNNTVSQFDSETILLTYIDNVTLGNLNLNAATLLNANISNTGWCEISLDVKVSNGFSWVQIAGISNNNAYKVTSTEYVRLTWRCLTNVGTPSIHVFTSAGNEPTSTLIKNISVKALAGNHAYQTTSAARPILQNTPRRIDFDAIDDKLITTLPAQLTGCTVIRSVPNVGTQILANQTIPTPYNDNTDHCGLIVINRALSPSETSAIAAEFNKRAGV